MKIGYISDYSGATHKVIVVDETISGKYIIEHDGELTITTKDKVSDLEEI